MPRMQGKPRVFISYARSDGLAFARELRDWLEEKQVPLFQDLVSLVGGEDFLLQIYKAIEQVEFLVLLMTPNALKSEAVKKECAMRAKAAYASFPSCPRSRWRSKSSRAGWTVWSGMT
jgi:predicted nucleotide-binding protein